MAEPAATAFPSGNLYLCPAASPAQTELGDWLFSGSLDIGFVGVGGDEDNALWNRYADWEDGFILGLLQLEFLRPRDGSYASLRASRISDDDAYFDAMFGRAGSYKVHAFLRELPNALSDSVRSIWNGVGSNHLTLVDSLQVGASTSEQVGAASQAAIERQVSVNRSKQGLGFSMYLDPRWSAFADVSHEQRKGARPFGGAMFFNFPFPDNGGILKPCARWMIPRSISIPDCVLPDRNGDSTSRIPLRSTGIATRASTTRCLSRCRR